MKSFLAHKITFEPFETKWWAQNPHVQTIVASQFTKVSDCEVRRLEVTTPDEDFVEIDVIEGNPDKPVVALFHGLEGSSNRHYIRNLMKLLSDKDYSCAALNFRGCGGKMNHQPGFYHSGDSEMYHFFIKWVENRFGSRKIYAAGFSLGANALVKYLGEQGEASVIEKAVAVSPPFDLKEGSLRLHKGFNRVYEKHFLHSLTRKLELKRKNHPNLPQFNGDSLYDFDNQVTAVLHGFKDADDYYERCSSKHFFEDVKTSLLVIYSEDDPICPVEFAPAEVMQSNKFIQVIQTKKGGHVGFLSSPGGWLNRQIMKWFEN